MRSIPPFDSRRPFVAPALWILACAACVLTGCGSAPPPPTPQQPTIVTTGPKAPAAPAAPATAPAAAPAATAPMTGDAPPMAAAVGPDGAPVEKSPPPPFEPPGVAFTDQGNILVGIGTAPDQVELFDVASGQIARQIPRQPSPITSVAYDPDSLWGATGAASGEVLLWSLARPKLGLDEFAAQATRGGDLDPLLGHSGPVLALRMNAPSGQLASAGADGIVRLWCVARPRMMTSLENQDGATIAALSPDGRVVFVGDQNGDIGIWGVEKLERLGKLEGAREPILHLLLSKDLKFLVGGDQAGNLLTWEIESRKLISRIPAHWSAMRGLAFREDGSELYSAGEDQRLRTWQFPLETITKSERLAGDGAVTVGGSDLVSIIHPDRIAVFSVVGGREVRSVARTGERPAAAVASGRGDVIATISREGAISATHTVQGRGLFDAMLEGKGIRQISLSPEGDSLVALPFEGRPFTVRVPSAAPQSLKTPAANLIAQLPGQDAFVTAGSDGRVLEWQASTGRNIRPVGAVSGAVKVLVASPVGESVAAASENTISVWSRQGDRWVDVTSTETAAKVEDLAWSAEGESLIAALAGGQLQVLSTDSKPVELEITPQSVVSQRGRLAAIEGNRLLIVEGSTTLPSVASQGPKFTALAMSPADGTIAVADQGKGIRLLPAGAAAGITISIPESGDVTALRFSPDGRQLLAGTADGRAGVFDLSDGAKSEWAPPESGVRAFAASPGDKTGAYLLDNGDVRILDRLSNSRVWDWKKPVGEPLDIAWSSDGRALAIAGTDGPVEVRNVETGNVIGRQTEKTSKRLAIALADGPSGLEMVSVLADGQVEIWTPGKSSPARLALEVKAIKSAQLAANGAHALLKTPEGALLLLSRKGADLKVADVSAKVVASAISGDDRRVAWSDEPRQIHMTLLNDQGGPKSFEADEEVRDLEWLDAQRLAVLTTSGKIKIYSPAGVLLETLAFGGTVENLHRGDPASGRLLVRAADGDRMVPVRLRRWIPGPPTAIADLCIVPQENLLFCCRGEGEMEVLDLASGLLRPDAAKGAFSACASTPDGQVILAADGALQRRPPQGKTLEPIVAPWKGGGTRLVEQGRNIAAVSSQGALLIQGGPSADAMASGDIVALSNGRPVVRSQGKLVVQSRAAQQGTATNANRQWKGVCGGPAGQQFALASTGELFRANVAAQSFNSEANFNSAPVEILRDPAKPQVVMGFASGEIWSWNWETRQRTRVAGVGEPVTSLSFDAASRTLAVGTDKGAYLIAEGTGLTVRVPMGSPVSGIAVLGGEQRMAVVHRSTDAEVLSLPQVAFLEVSAPEVTAISAEREQSVLWSGKDRTVHLVLTVPQRTEMLFSGTRGSIVSLFLSGEDKLYAVGASGEVTVWDRRAVDPKPQAWTIDRRFKKLVVDRSSSRIVLASAAGGGLIVDMAARLLLDELPESNCDPLAFADPYHVTAVLGESIARLPINARRTLEFTAKTVQSLFSVSGTADVFLASAGTPNGIVRGDVVSGTFTTAAELAGGVQRTATIAGVPTRVVTSSPLQAGKSTISLVDVLSGKAIWQRSVDGEISWLSAAKDQSIVATRTGLVVLLDTASGDVSQAFSSEPARSVFRIAGTSALLIVTETGRLVTTEVNSIRSLHVSDKGVTAVNFSPRGDYLVTGDEHGTVRVWNLATGAEVTHSEELKGSVSAVEFSNDGTRLFAGSLDGSAAAWSVKDLKPGEPLPAAKLLAHGSPVRTLAQTPAGERLVTAADDKIIRVWDLVTGFEMEQYLGHVSPPVLLHVSPAAENMIVSYDSTGSLRRWTRSAVSSAQIARPAPAETESTSTEPLPPPPPSRTSTSQAAAIAIKPAAPLRRTEVPPIDPNDHRPISLFGSSAPKTSTPQTAMRTSIGSQLNETVGALRKESDPTRREELRAMTSSLLDRLNALPTESDSALDLEHVQVQADGEGTGTPVALDLTIGEERLSAPLAAQQVVAIKTAYNFSPQAFRPVKMCITSDGKTVLSIQPGIPGREETPPQIPDDTDDATRQRILRDYELAKLRISQGVVEAWDVATRVRLRRWTQVRSLYVGFLDLTPNESTLYTVPDIFTFDLITGEHREVARGCQLALHADSKEPRAALARPGVVGGMSDILTLLDGQTLKEQKPKIEGFESFVSAMAFAPDGSRLIASIRERQRHRLVELEPATLKELAVLETVPDDKTWSAPMALPGPTRIFFLDSNLKFITYGQISQQKWQFSTWEGRKMLARTEADHPLIQEDFVRAGWPIAGTDLVAARTDAAITVVDVKKMQRVFAMGINAVHFGRPEIAVSTDGGWVATGDDGGNVALWHLPSGTGPFMFRPHLGPVVGLSFSKSREYLCSMGEENVLRVWKLSLPEAGRMRAYGDANKQKIQKVRNKKAAEG